MALFRALYSKFTDTYLKYQLKSIGVQQGETVDVPQIPIYDIFERQFTNEKFALKTALIESDTEISFRRLKETAETLSDHILNDPATSGKIQGIQTEVIGLLSGANKYRIISMLAVLRMRCAFVSIDVNAPHQHVMEMLKESSVKYIIYESNPLTDGIVQMLQNSTAFVMYDVSQLINAEPFKCTSPKSCPYAEADPLICIYFTSGSTGVQKGVPIHTSNLLNRLFWQWDCIPFVDDDVACHKTSVLFIDSLTEIFGSLLQGVPLVILTKYTISNPQSFVSAIELNKITRLVLVPSHLKMLSEYVQKKQCFERVSTIKCIICSGENLNTNVAMLPFFSFPLMTSLYNLYGSTETTGDVTYQCLKSAKDIELYMDENTVSVGKPITNSCVVILDEKGNICREGETGHIHVSGFNVVNRYLNIDSEKTVSILKNEIFQKKGHEKLYKMGDLGAVKNGRIYFRGRSGGIFKVRGHKVNMVEIENKIKKFEGIKECIVLPYTNTQGHNIPVAFYQKDPLSSLSINVQFLMEQSKLLFPSYAIPRFFEIEEFPLQTHTAKVDRQGLIKIFKEAVENPEASENEDHDNILTILAKHISVPVHDIALEKSFFENGGNSLTAITALSHLTSHGVNICLNEFLNAKSLREIVETWPNGENRDSYQSSSGLQHNYNAVMLNMVPNNERAIKLLAEGFTQKNPLDVLVGTQEQSFISFMHSIWQSVLTDDLSNVVVDETSGDIVGVTIVTDLKTELAVPENYEKMEVLEINEAVEKPVKEALLRDGKKWVDSLLDAVDIRLPDDVALSVLEMMGQCLVETATQRGYNGIFVINSHPVTMALAERQGFKTVNSLHVKTFCYKDRYPFKDAEDSYHIKAMVKYLADKQL